MIILMGIAGSGKGTQGRLLSENRSWPVISTGELLRSQGTPEQHARMHRGEILGDEEVTALLDNALQAMSDPNDCILDGYPRTISQAEWLLKQVEAGRFAIEGVFHLEASRQAVKARLTDRARQDDHEAAIEERFHEYDRATQPVLGFFRDAGVDVAEINAEQSIEAVQADLNKFLDKA